MPDLRPIREHGPAVAGGIDLDLPGRGVKLRGTRWPGRGTPVALLHGLASTRRFWNLVAPELVGAGHAVLALDHRGHGESALAPDGDYSPETIADDVATAMDAIGLDRAVLVGHSWSGAVALAFAARHSQRTLAVVALDGGFHGPVPPEERAERRRMLQPPGWRGAPEEVLGFLGHGSLAAYWDADRERAVLPIFGVEPDGTARARLPFDDHMRIVDTLLGFDPAPVLAGVAAPVWAIFCRSEAAGSNATGDLSLPASLAAVPGARAQIWLGALHDVPLQWPAAVAGVIRAAAADAERTSSAGGSAGRQEEVP